MLVAVKRMINVQKIACSFRFFSLYLLGLSALPVSAQHLEITLPEGKMTFQLIENQPLVTQYLRSAIPQQGDTLRLQAAVSGFVASLVTPVHPFTLPDSVALLPSAPHLHGHLVVPVDIDLQGHRTLRLDHLYIIDGRPFKQSEVQRMQQDFEPALKSELFLRLYDTVISSRFTPLPDSLRDRYGHPTRWKIRQLCEPLLDSVARGFTPPVLTAEDYQAYEQQGGFPNMDGKNLILGQLISGADVLQRVMQSEKAMDPRDVFWRLVSK